MKLQLNEKTLNAYLQRAINEEIDELFGMSRAAKNAAAGGYRWNPNMTNRQNRRARRAQKNKLDNEEMGVAGPAKYNPNYNKYFPTVAGQKAAMARARAWGQKNLDPVVANNLTLPYHYEPGPNGPIRVDHNQNQSMIAEGMDELFGSRARKQSKMMITGQTTGEESTQSLVGIINKLETALVSTENLVGISGTHQNLANGVRSNGWLGGFSMKKSLLNAINALTLIANRINTIERKTNMNKIMESVNGDMFYSPAKGDWLPVPGANPAGSTATRTGIGAAFEKAASAAGKFMKTPLKANATGMIGTLTTPAAIATAAFAIAQAAAVAAAKGRQRNIVRTYNCAAILAKRLGNIANHLNPQNTPSAPSAPLQEINVRRGKRSFVSIEQGMQALSQEMRRIGGATQGSTVNGQDRVFNIPQGIDLNTPEGVKAFQEWVNTIQDANGNVLITDNEGQPLAPDGKWGPKTNAAYDKIAQIIRQSGPVNEGLVMERKDIETALANLERVAGATGSGGNAYSSISAMSGGADASRLQNAQNIKNIIRTYPPVLNQYLNVLADAGAEVSGIQPLNVDTRPHRNYSINELTAIDERIQELLQIAQNVQTPEGEEGEQQGGNLIIRGTLPPKPVRRQNPNPNPTPAPPELPELEIPEIEDEPIEIEDVLMNLDSTMPEVPFMANPYTLESYGIIPNDKTGRITKRELKDKIRNAMAQGKLTPERAQELIRQVRQDYRNGVSQRYTNPDGTTVDTTDNARRATNRANRQAMRDANRAPEYISESRVRRRKLNENQFKSLVKQIIRESLINK